MQLSVSQSKLLEILVKNLNRRVHSVDLFFAIYDEYDKEFNEKSVRNFISSLRKKIPQLHISNVYGGYYMLRKEEEHLDSEFTEYLYDILNQSKNAIVITDPNLYDNPIIYVNNSFRELFGYTYEEVIGRNCRFLHKNDSKQEGLEKIRIALELQEATTVVIKNYTVENICLYNELTLSPIFNKKTGKIKYFLGIHKDLS